MLFYHIRIVKKNGKKVWNFDLSKQRVINEIVNPLAKWKPLMLRGSLVEPSDIEHIAISETEESSSKILENKKWRRSGEKLLNAFDIKKRRYYVDEHFVLHSGRNVTQEFVQELDLPTDLVKSEIFIVHGHDHETMKELKALLLELGLNPIVLHEQASGSRTIVEKLEKYSDVGYAFVILTPDDWGGTKHDFFNVIDGIASNYTDLEDAFHDKELQYRARQNVVLEFGYFIGRLGRDRVCCLYKGNVELPSDMHGIEYVFFNKSVKEKRARIIKELKKAGYEIKN
jgi:predicted nucleotide-binding protein